MGRGAGWQSVVGGGQGGRVWCEVGRVAECGGRWAGGITWTPKVETMEVLTSSDKELGPPWEQVGMQKNPHPQLNPYSLPSPVRHVPRVLLEEHDRGSPAALLRGQTLEPHEPGVQPHAIWDREPHVLMLQSKLGWEELVGSRHARQARDVYLWYEMEQEGVMKGRGQRGRPFRLDSTSHGQGTPHQLLLEVDEGSKQRERDARPLDGYIGTNEKLQVLYGI